MTVLSLSIRSATDPLGTPLATLTDEDVGAFSMRVSENSLGAGSFTIRRDHPSATDAILAVDNYVVVTIPAIYNDPVFGFWLEHHDDKVLAQGEEGDETLTRQGPGSLAIIGRANFLDQPYAPAPPASPDRGSANEIPGYWRWQAKQYGQIFKRLIEEGQNEPGTPLADVTTDFDRAVDSDGTDWPAIVRDVRFEIGTDGLTFMDRFAETGEVFITCTPGLLVQARQARGVNRTSGSFASGKVRLVKGVNIQSELVRSGDTSLAATHAIVVGMENTYVQVVSPSYVSGPGKWLRVDYGNSNDEGVLEKVGLEALARGVADLQEITMEIRAGDDQAAGHYLPFKHFNVSDRITVHTGTDPNDYNEQTERVRAFTIALRDATDDTAKGDITGDEMAARSLIVGVECGGAAGSFGVNIDVTVPEKGCGGCPEPPPITNPPPVTGLECTALNSTVYSLTEGGTRSGLGPGVVVGGNFTYTSTDFVQYWRAGGSPDEYPHAGLVGDWGNGGVCGSNFTSGTFDYNGGGIIIVVRITVIGPGVLTIHTAAHPGGLFGPCSGGPGNVIASAYISGASGGGAVDTDSQPPGSILTITIPDDGFCAHFVDISSVGPWGYGGANWTPTLTTTPVAGQMVESTSTGDGTTTSYTTPAVGGTPLPIKAGTQPTIEVGGVDWTPALHVTDAAAGEYDLDYPPPLGATVVLRFLST